MAPRDVLTAKSTVASREADIIAAEAQVKSAEDQLRSILNLMGDEKSAGAIIPADKPNLEIKPVDLNQSLAIAMQNRPELKSLKIDLDSQNFNLSVARNQLLPNLSFNASYTSPGLSGDRVLYLDNNPLSGIVVGTIPGGYSDAIKNAMKFLYRNWNINLTLDIPLSNILSRASLAQAQVSLKSSELQLKNNEQQIYLEIKSAVRDLETNAKRVQALKIATDLADQNLKAEQEKLRVGLSTPYQVLQFQEQLTRAKTSELQATINLNTARAKLDQVLGTSLESKNIRIADMLGNK
jgi:outer membrane protein TolC